MSYKNITDAGQTKDQVEHHEKDWGKYNDPPPGLQEITIEDFAQSGFFTWSHKKFETRYVDLSRAGNDKLTGWIHLQLFYMDHGEGYAMSHDYWRKKVRFFRFAKCYHDYKEISGLSWSCYHVCKCTKCGDTWEYDSSG